MEQVTNLFQLKERLKDADFEQCLEIIKDYQLVDSSESLDDYIEYILPSQLMLEWRSVKFTLKNVEKRQIV